MNPIVSQLNRLGNAADFTVAFLTFGILRSIMGTGEAFSTDIFDERAPLVALSFIWRTPQMHRANPIESRFKSPVLYPLGSGLQMLGLALMAGGMLALGAITAPVVFGHFSRADAAPVMALIFRRYDMVLVGALLLVWLGEFLRCLRTEGRTSTLLNRVRYGLLILLSGAMLYSTQVLNADIERMNKAGVHRSFTTVEGLRFERTHKLSESLYKGELLLVVLLILLTPFTSGNPSQRDSSGKDGHV